MNTNFLISFAIGLGVYFIGLFIFAIIKRHKNKKKFDKEMEEHEDQMRIGGNDEEEEVK